MPYNSIRYIEYFSSDSKQGQHLHESMVDRTNYIPRDGNCMLHCATMFLFDDMSKSMQLRQQIISHIECHQTLYDGLVWNESQLSVADYCNRMKMPGVFGDSVFLVAIAIMFRIRIVNYTLESTKDNLEDVDELFTKSSWTWTWNLLTKRCPINGLRGKRAWSCRTSRSIRLSFERIYEA